MSKNMLFILSGKYFESQMHVLLMLHVVYFFLDAGIILYKKILIIELFVEVWSLVCFFSVDILE